MWFFKGKYSGAAKGYIKAKERREFLIVFVIGSIVLLGISVVGGIAFYELTPIGTIIMALVGIGSIALIGLLSYLFYKREVKCEIEITNDTFYVYNGDNLFSCAFYKIGKIEYYEDFIVIGSPIRFILQKDILVKGDWEELKSLVRKIEESLKTENPMYQIEELESEFFQATVKGKRIFEKFVGGVSPVVPVGKYEYFVTFVLENQEEVEYAISQQWYESMEKGQTGTLVIRSGNFYYFGDEEDVE